jgi:hypothetical protein
VRPGSPFRRSLLAVPAALLALSLTACDGSGGTPATDDPSQTGGSGEGSPESSESLDAPTESPTADVTVPEGVSVTAQGSDLKFGDSATVIFEPDQKRDTVLQLTVTGARKGRLSDFKGFILDNAYKKKANYYYVDVAVENLGEGNVGGAPIPLWGVNQDNTLLPAVNFTTKFKPCASTPLPKKFKQGDSIDTCLVFLSPDKGDLESVSFRPDQAFDPIEWTGAVKPPKKDEKQGEKNGDKQGGKKNRKKSGGS